LLCGEQRRPRTSAYLFEEAPEGFLYKEIVLSGDRRRQSGAPITEAVAIQAAKDWITRFFGDVPVASTLVLEVGRSMATTPQRTEVMLRQEYRGLRTSHRSRLQLEGSDVVSAVVSMADFNLAGVDVSVIEVDKARSLWIAYLAAHGWERGAVERVCEQWVPMVTYYPVAARPGNVACSSGHVYMPSWDVIPDHQYKVDGITGEVWLR
jgi:hypothetical protein